MATDRSSPNTVAQAGTVRWICWRNNTSERPRRTHKETRRRQLTPRDTTQCLHPSAAARRHLSLEKSDFAAHASTQCTQSPYCPSHDPLPYGTSPVSGCAATAGDCGRDARTLASIRAWHASYSTSIVAHASVACRAHRWPAWREVVRYGSARCVRALHFASMVCFWSWTSSSSSLIGRLLRARERSCKSCPVKQRKTTAKPLYIL